MNCAGSLVARPRVPRIRQEPWRVPDAQWLRLPQAP